MFRRIARGNLKFIMFLFRYNSLTLYRGKVSPLFIAIFLQEENGFQKLVPRGAFWENLASIYFQDPPLENTLHEVNFSTYIVIP